MNKRRRSDRKSVAVALLNLVESDDEEFPTLENVQSSSDEDTSDEAEMSDEEQILHGPCNVDPAGADVNSRFFCVFVTLKHLLIKYLCLQGVPGRQKHCT